MTAPNAQSSSDDPTVLSADSLASGVGPETPPQLSLGQVFGAYRIERLLGRGGMGEVYEAEHLEQGRHVALKVLNQRLASREDRARFLREGQLAASISHPNSVYIYGSDEINGMPVIAMELLPGGTLKDRVSKQGPLAAGAAVDSILQMIAGLDAACAKGVLHRDIKPSNCFVTQDGAVKIGDFGLSISTLARDVTQVMLTTVGTFHGTPQYAAPEQIKGQPLDVRADIYAVGATLFYLLTGKAAFDGPDLLAVATRIATDPPPSPQTLQPTVPRALAAVVVACLAKSPAERPATYGVLSDRLRPFASAAPTPATLGRRFLAGVIDRVLLALPFLPVSLYIALQTPGTAFMLWWTLASSAVTLAYFAVSEGYWGQTIGKRLCGLRVTDRHGQPPGLNGALLRAVVYLVPTWITSVPVLILGQAGITKLSLQHPVVSVALVLDYYVLTAIQFSTIRRRNGYAALQDLASGSRVVQVERMVTRPGITDQVTPAPSAIAAIGPFKVVGTLGATNAGELFVGRDAALQRPVWLHRLPPGAEAVPAAQRDVARPGRLRWLTGRRTPTEAWDAYEALDGAPFVQVIRRPHGWRVVRDWLIDVLREMDAGLADGSLRAIGRDRVWITADGRARLLDFRAPGEGPDESLPASPASAKRTLTALANHALQANTRADAAAGLPLSARRWLAAVGAESTSLGALLTQTASFTSTVVDRISRRRRAAPLLVRTAIVVLMAVYFAAVAIMIPRIYQPEDQLLTSALKRLDVLAHPAATAPPPTAMSNLVPALTRAQERAALETYIAGHFRARIADAKTWENPITVSIVGKFRPLAQEVVAARPVTTAAEAAVAEAQLKPYLDRIRDGAAVPSVWLLGMLGSMATLAGMAGFGILSALAFRGGLLTRAFGMAIVTRTGDEAGRGRAAWRALIAWTPAIVASVLLMVTSPAGPQDVATLWHRSPLSVVGIALIWLTFLGGVAWAVSRPSRGLHDRIAGTWLVPQ